MGGTREYSVHESNKEWSIKKNRDFKFLLYCLKLFSGSWMSFLLLLIFIFLSLHFSLGSFYRPFLCSLILILIIQSANMHIKGILHFSYGVFYFYYFILNSLLRISISLLTLLACSYMLSTISIIALISIAIILKFLSDDSKIYHKWVQFWHFFASSDCVFSLFSITCNFFVVVENQSWCIG